MLSVIIPSYKDPLLHKTIDDILENFTGEFEIIPVLDGYKTEIKSDTRIKPIYLDQNVGMREAINIGVQNSNGEYLMRTDEHCKFAKGFDSEILSSIQDNWIVTARRYCLNPETWELMDIPPYDYEKLIILNKEKWHKFHGERWRSRTKERADVMLDENMAFQGSMWVMSRKHWDKVIQRLDSDNYGTLYQDTTEMLMKTWGSGGKLMLNKNTWYAHKHVSFNRTHNHTNEQFKAFEYALETWGDYYEREIRPRFGI